MGNTNNIAESKEFELFQLSCTFSFLGTKEQAIKEFNNKDLFFDVDEFEGTEDEHHSGSFTEIISVNNNESLIDVVRNYFNVHNQNLHGECFSVRTITGIKLFTEEDIEI